MFVYAIVILIIVFLRLKLDNSLVGDPDYKQETIYLKYVCGILVLLAGLRGNSVGADTISYAADYEKLADLSLGVVFTSHGTLGTGYYVISKLFSMTGLSVHCWFCFVALFYTFAMYKFVQKYSRDKLVSILCFFTMGLFTFSLAGLKQTMAMGFVTISFLSLNEQKYLKTLFLFALAYWCHSSTSIFAFAVVLYFLKNSKVYYYVLFAFVVTVFLFGDWIWQTSIGFLNDEHYIEIYSHSDNIYSAWTFVFYLLLAVLTLFSSKNYHIEEKSDAKLLYGMTMLAVAFQSLATSFSSAFRVAYFFVPFMTVLIPNCCVFFDNNNNKSIWKILMCSICVFWMLYSSRDFDYLFFWQE